MFAAHDNLISFISKVPWLLNVGHVSQHHQQSETSWQFRMELPW